jgi:hypothetical protein
MTDIQLQMCILLYRGHLDELQRKHLELGHQLRTSQQTIAHPCKPHAGSCPTQYDPLAWTVARSPEIAAGPARSGVR